MPPLWPVVLSVVWHFGSVPDGYAAAKVLGAVLASTVVFPVWLLGRELVGPRLALLPAGLAVAGAWMQTTSFVMSDNLAYPLAAASLAATVMAVRRGGTRWIWVSLGFAVAAILCRTQLLVLPVILVVALAIDVLRQPAGQRLTRVEVRPRALWIGLILVVGGGLLALAIDPGLTRYALLSKHVDLGRILDVTGKQAASTLVLFALIPVVAAVALMLRKANWRDDATGPLLATLAATVLVLYPVLGRFEAYGTSGPVDRYVMYLAPLLFIALVMAPGRISRRPAVGVAVALSVAVAGAPKFLNYLEQPGLYGAEKRVAALGGFFGDHVAAGMAILALPLAVAGALALTSRTRRGAGLAIAAGVGVVVMAGQHWTSQHHEINLIREYRSTVAPPQLDWVDRHADGPVANLSIGKQQRLSATPDLYTDFFNKRVDHLYSTVTSGVGECRVHLRAAGALVPSGSCPAWPREFVLQQADFRATLRGQRVLARTPAHGTLVRVPAGAPRVLGLVKPPCSETGCTSAVQIGLYLAEPARVAVTFTAAQGVYTALVNGKTRILERGKPNTIRFRAAAGDHGFVIPVNWKVPAGAPDLASVTLKDRSGTTRLW